MSSNRSRRAFQVTTTADRSAAYPPDRTSTEVVRAFCTGRRALRSRGRYDRTSASSMASAISVDPPPHRTRLLLNRHLFRVLSRGRLLGHKTRSGSSQGTAGRSRIQPSNSERMEIEGDSYEGQATLFLHRKTGGFRDPPARTKSPTLVNYDASISSVRQRWCFNRSRRQRGKGALPLGEGLLHFHATAQAVRARPGAP